MCFPAQQSRKQQRLNRASPIQHALQLGTATTSYPNASTYKSYQQCLKTNLKLNHAAVSIRSSNSNSLHRQLHKHLRTTPFTKVYLLAYSPPTLRNAQHTVITSKTLIPTPTIPPYPQRTHASALTITSPPASPQQHKTASYSNPAQLSSSAYSSSHSMHSSPFRTHQIAFILLLNDRYESTVVVASMYIPMCR
jgi:hypothetical protein